MDYGNSGKRQFIHSNVFNCFKQMLSVFFTRQMNLKSRMKFLLYELRLFFRQKIRYTEKTEEYTHETRKHVKVLIRGNKLLSLYQI